MVTAAGGAGLVGTQTSDHGAVRLTLTQTTTGFQLRNILKRGEANGKRSRFPAVTQGDVRQRACRGSHWADVVRRGTGAGLPAAAPSLGE